MVLKPLSNEEKLTITETIESALDRINDQDVQGQREEILEINKKIADSSNEVFCVRGFSREDLIQSFGLVSSGVASKDQIDSLSDEKLQEIAKEIRSRMTDDFIEVLCEVFSEMNKGE